MSETAQNPELENAAHQLLLEVAQKLAVDPGWMSKLEAEALIGNETAKKINQRIRSAASVVPRESQDPQWTPNLELADLLIQENIL